MCVAAALDRRRRIKCSSWLQLVKLSLGIGYSFPAVSLTEALTKSSIKLFTHEVREDYPLNLSI
jgi:hypothetical protein